MSPPKGSPPAQKILVLLFAPKALSNLHSWTAEWVKQHRWNNYHPAFASNRLNLVFVSCWWWRVDTKIVCLSSVWCTHSKVWLSQSSSCPLGPEHTLQPYSPTWGTVLLAAFPRNWDSVCLSAAPALSLVTFGSHHLPLPQGRENIRCESTHPFLAAGEELHKDHQTSIGPEAGDRKIG